MEPTPYQVMPSLSADEYAALKADIAARGVQVPVEYDDRGNILDGHHRVQICGELGIVHWPKLVRYGLSEEEKRRHARRLNLDRRHLDQQQRRSLIEDELRERPEASDRLIASGLGVDHKTVGAVRDALLSTNTITYSEKRHGKDGKARRVVRFIPSTEDATIHRKNLVNKKQDLDRSVKINDPVCFDIGIRDLRKSSIAQIRSAAKILSLIAEHCGGAESHKSVGELMSDAAIAAVIKDGAI